MRREMWTALLTAAGVRWLLLTNLLPIRLHRPIQELIQCVCWGMRHGGR